MTKKIKELRVHGDRLGRQGMSLLAIYFINKFNDDPSYKNAMKLCGQLSVIAKAATCDDYWHEKTKDGVRDAEFKITLVD